MRKLASIQKVSNVRPIEGADAIEVLNVEGWNVVAKKGQFKDGDLAIYIEIDSICPARDEFDFLAPRKYKIKTIKLRKQISQGICFSVNDFPETKGKTWNVGDDVTDLLGIKKNEPDEWNKAPIFTKKDRSFYARHIKPVLYQWAFGLSKNPSLTAPFPAFIPKTDETRVQWMRPLLNSHKGKRFYKTEKLDGSSMTCYIKDDHFGVCSRNLELLLYKRPVFTGLRKVWADFIANAFNLRPPTDQKESHFWKTAVKIGLDTSMLKEYKGRSLAIQGEIVGPGIQENKYGLKEHDFFIFNVYDIEKKEYFNLEDCLNFANILGIKFVPVITDNFVLDHDVDAIVELSKGKSVLNNKQKREGIVLRPYDNINGDCAMSMVSFKAINPEFLLEEKD